MKGKFLIIKKLAFTLFILFVNYTLLIVNCYPQAAINTTGNSPDNSAVLDISSTDSGVLINRMTTAQRDNIANVCSCTPAQGLMIFNTTTNCFEAFVNGGWYSISCPAPCSPPAAPVAAPASVLNCTSFNANWSASAGALYYFLDLSTVSSFATFVPGYNNLNVGNTTSFSVIGLTANTNYYYRVRAATTCPSPNSGTIMAVTTSVCFTCGNAITDSRDSKSYPTVLIGTQCWMAKNLEATKYLNGDNVQFANDDATWQFDPNGAYCYYNYASSSIYGPLYNRLAAVDSRGLCPNSWHLPSQAEWVTLFNYLGGTSVAGGHMKETGLTHWQSPNTGADNSSGFKALPGGLRDGNVSGPGFTNSPYWACFWEGPPYNEFGNGLIVYWDGTQVLYNGIGWYDQYGFSVRCVEN
jgi:uncharacterized protein (TIGR02145 family)